MLKGFIGVATDEPTCSFPRDLFFWAISFIRKHGQTELSPEKEIAGAGWRLVGDEEERRVEAFSMLRSQGHGCGLLSRKRDIGSCH